MQEAPLPQELRNRFPHKFAINSLPWTATGVIKDLPAGSPSTPVPSYNDLLQDFRSESNDSSDRRAAKVLQLALKDILKTVKDATMRVGSKTCFDFDILAQNFPALCLRVLPSPTLIFSSTPAPSKESWPLQIPNITHRDLVERQIVERLQRTSPPREDLVTAYLEHLENVYARWSNMSREAQQEVWQTEILRGYATEREKRVEMERKLEDAVFEYAQLRTHFRTLYRHSVHDRHTEETQEASGKPAEEAGVSYSYELSADVARELKRNNTAQWDYDRVVDKWNALVQEPQRSSSVPSSQSNHDHQISRTWSPAMAIHAQQAGRGGRDTSYQISQGNNNTNTTTADIAMIDAAPVLSVGERQMHDGGDKAG